MSRIKKAARLVLCSLLLSLLFVGRIALCQNAYNFTELTTADGLSSNTITVILEDKYGITWFGTPNGLNKYDGSNFVNFRHEVGDSLSLPGNEIYALFQNKDGKLWIGTSNGLCYYDYKNNQFISQPSFRQSAIRSICSDYAGNIWVGSYSDLKIIDKKTGDVLAVQTPARAKSLENVWSILSLFEDNQKRMWVGSQVGLYCYDRSKRLSATFIHSKTDGASISSNYVTGISQDQSGVLWFATLEGLNTLNQRNQTFQVVRETEVGAPTKGGDIIHAIARLGRNQLWLATEDGLRIFETDSRKLTKVRADQRNPFSLRSNQVKSLCMGTMGVYWIGLARGGVNKMHQNLALFDYQQSNAFSSQGLSSPVVTSFAEKDKQSVFVGTENGLQLFDLKQRIFKSYNIQSRSLKKGEKLSILSLKRSKNGTLWIGSYQDGLFKFDPQTGAYQQYIDQPERNPINENVVFSIEEDKRGDIWVGTNGGGVKVLDPRTGSVIHYKSNSTTGSSRLPVNGYIRAIIEDTDGLIWLGSYGSGIALFSPSTKRFSLLNAAKNRLINDHVNSILIDKKSNVWVGSNGGLSRYNKREGLFENFGESEGLPSRVIYKILEDNKGTLWLSTDKGLSNFNPVTKRFTNYGKENKVQNSPFITGSGLALSNGVLFFGSESGFNYFNPLNLSGNNFLPRVVLTELKVSNNTIRPSDEGPIQSQIDFADEIKLAYGQNFSISYVALNYSNPQQSTYSYKLHGLDKDWNYVGSSKTAQYTNLDPGEYTFQVRAGNSQGLWGSQIKSVKIKVLPPWWRTNLAYALYLITAVLAFYYLRQRSIRKIRMQLELEQEKLRAGEQIEQERRQAERLHELDLLKIKFLTNLSHEFRTPISLILAPVEKMLATEQNSAVLASASMIKRNARRLLNLVNQLLDFRKMEEQELRLNLAKGDLIAAIKEAVTSFNDVSERKSIHLEFDTELERLPAAFDHDKIERIVFNLLSNAFKFTLKGGHVSVHVYLLEEGESQSRLCLQVCDTGIGIPLDKQEQIFERFFQDTDSVSILNQGSGIGLSITREFVKMHRGEISVSSEPDKGTTFTVIIPVLPAAEPETIVENLSSDQTAVHLENEQPEVLEREGTQPVVLIIEDNDDFRFYLRENLKSSYQIVEASNGREGWQKVLSCHPELIVSDISMPFMDGIQLSKKIKADKRTSHIPVILLTALTDEEEQVKGLESGANDYLTKPFNFEILNAKVRNLLALNRTMRTTYSKQIQVLGPEVNLELRNTKLLNSIHQYIDIKLNDKTLSVEDLSKHVGMSRATLYHKVLELTGLSPIEYIRSVKLDKAAALLEKTDMNVSEVAYVTGFGTPNYFARMFKIRFKMLPSEYVVAKRKEKVVEPS